jgi:hypothetical protein
MQIDRGCLYGIVAKQLTDGIEIIPLIEEMGSEANDGGYGDCTLWLSRFFFSVVQNL